MIGCINEYGQHERTSRPKPVGASAEGEYVQNLVRDQARDRRGGCGCQVLLSVQAVGSRPTAALSGIWEASTSEAERPPWEARTGFKAWAGVADGPDLTAQQKLPQVQAKGGMAFDQIAERGIGTATVTTRTAQDRRAL